MTDSSSTDADSYHSILEEQFYTALAAAILDPQFDTVFANIAAEDLRSRKIPMSPGTRLPNTSAVAISDTIQRGFVRAVASLVKSPSLLGVARGIAVSEEEDPQPERNTTKDESGAKEPNSGSDALK